MATNYDKIAWFYDLLSRLVYGKYIIKSQVCLLKYVPTNSNILIVGGGTGWILEELSTLYNSGLTIDYVESSAKMIALSKKRWAGDNMVHYINLPIENFTAGHPYDVIMTPFLFDNFQPDKATLVFNNLSRQLKNNGIWLYADFVYNETEGTWWQKLLLKIMYLFFRITCNIETSEIENMEGLFKGHYQKIFESWFYGKFIRSQAYQKL